MPEEVVPIEDSKNNETRALSKKRLGAFVVALILLVMLALGYYYTEEQETTVDTVVVAVRGYLSVEQKDALTAQLAYYDPSEDGEPVTLKVFEFPASMDAAPNAETPQLFSQLMTEITGGPSDLYLLDANVYDMLGDERLFADLSELYPNDAAVTRRYLYAISGKPFSSAEGLENLPELYFALRSEQSSAVNKNAQTLKKHSMYRALLDRVQADKTVRNSSASEEASRTND